MKKQLLVSLVLLANIAVYAGPTKGSLEYGALINKFNGQQVSRSANNSPNSDTSSPRNNKNKGGEYTSMPQKQPVTKKDKCSKNPSRR